MAGTETYASGDGAQQPMDAAKEKAQDVKAQAGDQLRKQVDERSTQVGDQLDQQVQDVRAVADTVYEVMREVFAAPEGDRYQIVHQHEPGELLVEDTGLGI